MLTVACVLKGGGEYRPEHVEALRCQVREHLSLPHRFVCFTDVAGLPCATTPLAHGWPGWWSKIELFDGRLTGDVLYLDLDTAIVGAIDDLVTGHHRLTVLANFWGRGIGSGLMAWSGDLTGIYRRFVPEAERIMAEYVTKERWGDQAYIHDTVPAALLDHWQVRHPGRVVSYRKHVEPLGRVPAGASIICFGGQRRPWNTRAWRSS